MIDTEDVARDSVSLDFLQQIMRPQSGRILIVEDNLHQRNLIARILKVNGFDVHEVADGSEALLWLNEHAEMCDVILLDIMMPTMDGGQTLRELKRNNHTLAIPVIMLTALDGAQRIADFLKQGAADYVTKPYSPEELLGRIVAHIRVRQLQRMIRAVVTRNVQNAIAAGLADTLHNRLMALTGYFSLWQKHSAEIRESDPSWRLRNTQLGRMVNTSFVSLHSAIDELLDYTRGTAQYRVGEVEIRAVIMTLVEEYREYINFNLPDFAGIPPVAGDAEKLHHCFRELICNSLDADAMHLTITFQQDMDGYLCIHVADDGRGMSREVIDCATLPFFTTKGKEHTGLVGLWSTQQYIRSIGGEIRLESDAMGGTTVSLCLPIFGPAAGDGAL